MYVKLIFMTPSEASYSYCVSMSEYLSSIWIKVNASVEIPAHTISFPFSAYPACPIICMEKSVSEFCTLIQVISYLHSALSASSKSSDCFKFMKAMLFFHFFYFFLFHFGVRFGHNFFFIHNPTSYAGLAILLATSFVISAFVAVFSFGALICCCCCSCCILGIICCAISGWSNDII